MNYQALFAANAERVVRAGLIGVGQFGASLIARARAIPNLSLPALCDRDLERARRACLAAGFAEGELLVCASLAEAEAAIAAGRIALVADAALLVDLPLEVVVEATGDPEAAAANAEAALGKGKHLVMASKEADSVIGPLLARRARQAGLVATPVEGDQPSLLIGLLSWARLLGLDVVCAGKSSEYDFVFDPDTETVTWQDQCIAAPGFGGLWNLPERGLAETLKRRAEMLSEIPQRTVPDLCEMAVVGNATGLVPDVPEFHLPVMRALEVPEVFRPRTDGGLLGRSGVVDVFNCLRRPDEQSFAGGVFVVVRCTERETWEVLRGKGIPVSRTGGHALVYSPSHLLGVEAPVSILSAALLGQPTGGTAPRPVVDLVARTSRTWRAGETLAITNAHHHEVAGLEPLLIGAGPPAPGHPLPYYMATGCKLRSDVAAGRVVTAGMVEPPAGSALWRLRAEQDAAFAARAPTKSGDAT